MESLLALSQLQVEQRPTSPQNTIGQPEEVIMGQVTWTVEMKYLWLYLLQDGFCLGKVILHSRALQSEKNWGGQRGESSMRVDCKPPQHWDFYGQKDKHNTCSNSLLFPSLVNAGWQCCQLELSLLRWMNCLEAQGYWEHCCGGAGQSSPPPCRALGQECPQPATQNTNYNTEGVLEKRWKDILMLPWER